MSNEQGASAGTSGGGEMRVVRAGELPPAASTTPDLGPIVTYNHHGRNVAVRENLKGRHREHCLCYGCQNYRPDDPANHCVTAKRVYETCVQFGVVTPVWECPSFVPVTVKGNEAGSQSALA